MIALAMLLAGAMPYLPSETIAAMRDHKRVLVVGAPTAADPQLRAQRRIVVAWRDAARARDLVLVQIVGDRVTGAADTAAALRRRYRLPASGFAAVLIGKDGGVKLRATRPIAAATLAATIDAMPMRRAGLR